MSSTPFDFDALQEGQEVAIARYRPSSMQLLYFTLCTYNGHRIHVDREWARREGHTDLVVHGKLQAALLAKTAVDWAGASARLAYFEVQNRASAYLGHELVFHAVVRSVAADEEGQTVDLKIWEEDGDGRLLMPGCATIAIPERGECHRAR